MEAWEGNRGAGSVGGVSDWDGCAGVDGSRWMTSNLVLARTLESKAIRSA